jgi:hypothetical protein
MVSVPQMFTAACEAELAFFRETGMLYILSLCEGVLDWYLMLCAATDYPRSAHRHNCSSGCITNRILLGSMARRLPLLDYHTHPRLSWCNLLYPVH